MKLESQSKVGVAVEARVEIDRLIAVLNDYSRPFAVAVTAVTRLCALPIRSPEGLASLRDGCRKAANDLRAHMRHHRNAAAVSDELLALERALQKLVEQEAG